jgi:hypothetical protein
MLRSFQAALAFKSSQIFRFYTRHRLTPSRIQTRDVLRHRRLCAASDRSDLTQACLHRWLR